MFGTSVAKIDAFRSCKDALMWVLSSVYRLIHFVGHVGPVECLSADTLYLSDLFFLHTLRLF